MHFCADATELVASMRWQPPDAIIVDLVNIRDTANRSAVRAIAMNQPAIALILYLSLTCRDVRDLASIAADIKPHAAILREVDDVMSSTLGAIATARDMGAIARMIGMIDRAMPPSLRSILVFVAHNTNRPLSVREVARYGGVSSRTLFQRFRAAGVPSVALLIRWMRLLHVAAMLEVDDITVTHIADCLHFPSTATLRRMVKRFTGFTPQQLRGAGGLAYLLGVVEAQMLDARPMRNLNNR